LIQVLNIEEINRFINNHF